MPIGNDPDYTVLWDDFDRVALDSATVHRWTVDKDASATAGILADTANGILDLSSQATTDDNGSSIQGNEIFQPVAGRDIWFETLVQSTDSGNAVDDQDMCFGLTINFSNPEGILTAADRIVFEVNDGDANIDCITEFSGAETRTDSGIDVTDATDIILGFHVHGISSVEFFVNRVLVRTHTTNIVTDQLLTVAAMQLSGSTSNTKSISVDYIYVCQTRTP